MAKKPATIQGEKRCKTVLTIVFAVVAIVYLLPIFLVLVNSFKANAYVNTETFAMPNEESFVGFDNYVKGMTFGNYPFAKSVGYSLFITIVSSALILVCTSMAACVVHIFLVRTASQEYSPPVTFAIFYDVGMTGT